MTRFTKEELNNLSKSELVNLVMDTQEKYFILSEMNEINKMERFGRKSERMEIEGQLSFNEAEAEYNVLAAEPDIEEVVVIQHRKKHVGKRDEDLSKFPLEVVNLEMSDEELNQKFGEKGYKCLPDEVYRKLMYCPAKQVVLEYHVHVYAGKDNGTIVKAKRPDDLLTNSIVTPSLLAAIVNMKYVNALPLYRIEQEFQRNELNISRQTMSNWIIHCTERYASLIYDRMHDVLIKEHVVQADETPVLVNKDDRKSGSKSYMWVYRTNRYNHKTPAILYEYEKTRKADHPKEFLKDFDGYLVCDGYQAYHKVENESNNIKVAGCWVHLRRYFSRVIKASKKDERKGIHVLLAKTAIEKIAKIYAIEDKLTSLTPEERLKIRCEQIKPLAEEFFAWVKENQMKVLPKSETGEGFTYALNQEKYLMRIFEDGNIPIDNNCCEQSIRPFCVGKKNFVMIDTVNGANASAILYSLAETAKANNLKPYEYFKYIFTEIPKHMDDSKMEFIDSLLPWSNDIPQECRKNLKQ